MSITKDEKSDLNSLIERKLNCEKQLWISTHQALEAARQLESFLYNLEEKKT